MTKAIFGARIFDGKTWYDEAALLICDGTITDIVPEADIPAHATPISAEADILVPGFIDLQVNGGGGVMFNDAPSIEGIRTICTAHARFGTTALLPTLITDTRETTMAAIVAGRNAISQRLPGFLGLHLEGPHLSVARKGAHDPALIRPMEEADLQQLLDCRSVFPAMMVTVAPENVLEGQVARMAEAGLIVSLGHTETSFETAERYANAGARTVTHLFNAMSPLGHREPGMVGAALDNGCLHAGIIADGIHVHPTAMRVALRSKTGPGHIFVVTDAMSPIGTDLTSFTLNGREILRRNKRLTLRDGTLAGADIDMISSFRFLHHTVGLSLEEAIQMVSGHPAEAAQVADKKGALKPGFDADFVLLGDDLTIRSTWIDGTCVYRA